MSDAERANQARWDRLVEIHARSAFYDVDGFRAGKISLRSIEREELGDVAGKTLLHLQCHFGLDTLSWARLGARVTGVDFSEKAIALACSLSRETGLAADFFCASIYGLPQVLSGRFDIVYTSYGVLCWLPDLWRWAEVIAHFLEPGGTFYIVEGHPFANVFYNERDATGLQVAYPYFHDPAPQAYISDGSYADSAADIYGVTYEWSHSLGDILNALLAAGLRIEFLHEFPYGGYQHFPFMTQNSDGWWVLPEHGNSVPLLFSLKAVKPGLPT